MIKIQIWREIRLEQQSASSQDCKSGFSFILRLAELLFRANFTPTKSFRKKLCKFPFLAVSIVSRQTWNHAQVDFLRIRWKTIHMVFSWYSWYLIYIQYIYVWYCMILKITCLVAKLRWGRRLGITKTLMLLPPKKYLSSHIKHKICWIRS